MNRIRPLIAVVDDEPQFCKAVARLLKTHALDVVTFTRGEEFLADFASQSPDCLLLDLHMPDLSGFEVLERIAAHRIPSLVITGHDQPGNAERVRALGAMDYFLKPVNESQLVDAIRAAIDRRAPTIVPSDNPRPKQ
jgi:FixJ family two-component response regulator